MKFGNIDFDVNYFSTVSWEEFNAEFAGKLYGADIRLVYKELTGRTPDKTKKDGKNSKPDKKAGKV